MIPRPNSGSALGNAVLSVEIRDDSVAVQHKEAPLAIPEGARVGSTRTDGWADARRTTNCTVKTITAAAMHRDVMNETIYGHHIDWDEKIPA